MFAKSVVEELCMLCHHLRKLYDTRFKSFSPFSEPPSARNGRSDEAQLELKVKRGIKCQNAFRRMLVVGENIPK